jgi:hypothetical protein
MIDPFRQAGSSTGADSTCTSPSGALQSSGSQMIPMLQSQGVKWVMGTRHRLAPEAYELPSSCRSSSVKPSEASVAAPAGTPEPSMSTSALPSGKTPRIPITFPLSSGTHTPLSRS